MRITREHLKTARETTLAVVVLGLLGAAMSRGADPVETERRADGMIAAARLQAESGRGTAAPVRMRSMTELTTGDALRVERTEEDIIARGQYHD
jgi:hypothetical protein